MKNALLFGLMISATASVAQIYSTNPFTEEYKKRVDTAYKLHAEKRYGESARTFSTAFAANGGRALMNDQYGAAASWALAGNKDSALSILNVMAGGRYLNYNHLLTDPDFVSLYDDPRWKAACTIIKKNRTISQTGQDTTLMNELDTIIQNDQRYRLHIAYIQEKYGQSSKEMTDLTRTINEFDSINIIKAGLIVDKYGWPSSALVGQEDAQAVFLVIQHADLKTQEKYLPMLRKAVQDHQALPASLALLEDRVALAQGKKQIYGTQVSIDSKGQYYVENLIDPDNVDKRRAELKMQPLAVYLQQWNIKWNVEEYKKQQSLQGR